MACFSGPRMRTPSISACPPMVVRKAPLFSSSVIVQPFSLLKSSIAQAGTNCNICSFILLRPGQGDGDQAAAALGVDDVEGAVVEVYDLVAHRQADTAAPGLGGALVELLLDEGQLRLGDAGAIEI